LKAGREDGIIRKGEAQECQFYAVDHQKKNPRCKRRGLKRVKTGGAVSKRYNGKKSAGKGVKIEGGDLTGMWGDKRPMPQGGVSQTYAWV